jgi:hypothetical protein
VDHLGGQRLQARHDALLEVVERRAELDLVYDLVRTRIVTRIVGGEWRSSRFPENRDYLARNLEWLVNALEHMPARPGAADAAGLAAVAEESGR